MINKNKVFQSKNIIIFCVILIIIFILVILNLRKCFDCGYDPTAFPRTIDLNNSKNALRQLLYSDKIISLYPSEYTIDKNKYYFLAYAIKNINTKELYYAIRIDPMDGGGGTTREINFNKWFSINKKEYKLESSSAIPDFIKFKIPEYINADRYFFTLSIIDVKSKSTNNVYAQHKFTIIVNE
ncbi:MAG: hypothetical protein AABX33_06195 [Nanoarchaeota archaeon]